MKRSLKIALSALAVLTLGLLGATAIAARSFHHGEFMKQRVSAFVDDALDAAKVSQAQRSAVYAARDQAFAQLGELHKGRGEHLDEALALFAEDRLDAARVESLRRQKEAQVQKAGDAIESALIAAHDALGPDQRRAVAAYVREHRPGHHVGALRGEMMKRFASGRIEDALDAIHATPEQRAAIEAARDHVFAAFAESHAGDEIGLAADRAIALFEADRVDTAQVAKLRADHQAKMKKVGDAVVQAIYDVHDALTPEQRSALVAHIRAEHAKWTEGSAHHGMTREAAPPSTTIP